VLALLPKQLSTLQIIEQIFLRTLKKAPAALYAQLQGLFTKESAALFATLFLLWLAGHLDGVSEVIDAAVILATAAVFIYTVKLTFDAINAIIHMIRDLCQSLERCQDEFDLDQSAQDFADLIAFAGAAILFEIVARIVKHVTGKITYRPSGKYIGPYKPASVRFKRCIELMGQSKYAERASAVLAMARALPKYRYFTETQLVLIRAYTDPLVTKLGELKKEWTKPTQSGGTRFYKDWEFVNRLLRETDTPVRARLRQLVSRTAPDLALFKESADYIDSMVEAVEKVPPQPATVFRVVDGATKGMRRQLRLWTPVIEKGFMSTSTNEGMITREWSTNKAEPIILKILSRSGRSIDDISAFQGQDELLIPPGRKFMFVAKRRVRISRHKTALDASGNARPVMRPKMVRDPSGALVQETRWNPTTQKNEPVMEHVLEEVDAEKFYGFELGDELLVEIFGTDVAFRSLVQAMQGHPSNDHHDADHP
jgi:hypothetical protein